MSHRRSRQASRQLMVAAVALLLLVVPAGPALAHAFLVEARPADDQVLAAAPREVVLRFNEPIEPLPHAIRVVDAEGKPVQVGAPAHGEDAAVLRVALAEDLAQGTYLIGWRAIAADGHPLRGTMVFYIGEPTGEAPARDALLGESSLAPYEAAAAGLRWLLYLLVLFAAGGTVFTAWIHDGGSERRRLHRFIAAAAAAGLGVTLLALLLQAMITSGLGLAVLTRLETLLQSLLANEGRAAAVRVGGLAAVLLILARSRFAPYLAAAGGLAALASFTLTGHSAVSEPRWLAVTAHLLHVGTAAIWFGGLVLLVWVLHARRPHEAGERDEAAAATAGAAMVARFSRWAAASVMLLVAAGIALAWAEVPSVEALTGTQYGQTLLAKSGLVLVVLLTALYNNRRLLPALADGGRGAWQRLTRRLKGEVAGLTAVLLVTAVLVSLAPARLDSLPQSPFVAFLPVGAYEVNLIVDPARAGTNEFHIFVQHPDGRQADVVDEGVTLLLQPPDRDLAPLEREAPRVAPAHYLHVGPELALAGAWEVQLVVHFSDALHERAAATLTIP